ncbi:MAG: CDP-alcohol phosphatidyltransferase family protein [Victivallales bacterium]|nr:CDP-alcohol phosphatidyltransferase family protein [Victivallales bacterium]
MKDFRIITAIVLGMLTLERIFILKLTKSKRGQEFVRSFLPLHPNSISVMRLPMGIISAVLAANGLWCTATLWFSFWMISDLTDGTIARNCDLGSETGKWLDPLSDKFMYFPVLLLFCFSKETNVNLEKWPVFSFIIIDVIGQFSRLFVKKKAANQFGKAKTALVTILLSLLALNQIDDLIVVNSPVANGIMIAALILAFLSCYCKIIPDNWYANTLTLANFICGLLAIYQAVHGHFLYCMILVFIGQFFDLFDGRLARKYGSTKRGALFDDIADATSFGFAIGTMIFCCLKEKYSNINAVIAALIAIFYCGCLIYRLYRFLKPTKQLPKGIFQGLPSPAGAMFAGSAVLVALECHLPFGGIPSAICVILSSFLMVSNVEYCHVGQTLWPAMPKAIKLLLMILFTILAVFAITQKMYRPSFVYCCFGFTLFYLIYGINSVNRIKPVDNPQ